MGLGILITVSQELVSVRIHASESRSIHTIGRGVRIVQIAASPKRGTRHCVGYTIGQGRRQTWRRTIGKQNALGTTSTAFENDGWDLQCGAPGSSVICHAFVVPR